MRRFHPLIALLFVSACASGSKAVIEPLAPIAGQTGTVEEIVAAADAAWENRLDEAELRKGISLYETAYAMQPGNKWVLDHLATAYYQLGYAYTATDAGKIALHDRGRQFALKRLELHPGYKSVIDAGGSIEDAVAKITDKDYAHALIFAATNWGWWADKKGISKVAFDIGKVKALFFRAIDLDATYLCSAPKMMAASFYAKAGAFGGDMEKAKQYFEEAIKEEGCYDNKMLYAEFVAIPTDDQELFHRLATEVLAAPEDTTSQVRLENRVAKEKAKALLAKEAELF